MRKQPHNFAFEQCFKRWIMLSITLLIMISSGCAQLRLPAIDPSGNGIFRPGGTQLLTPRAAQSQSGLQSQVGQQNFNPAFQPQPFTPPQNISQGPVQPAFQHPATPPPCDGPAVTAREKKKHFVPTISDSKTPGQNGQIILTPSRIVAPVGSEVVVLAGICGGDGFFVKNQPLEWMLSNNSVGQMIEVGGQHHPKFNQLIPPTVKKFSGQYAWGRTGMKNVVLTRGTPTPVDDIELANGQTFVSVSSVSPGTSYVTAVAPNAEGWDKRKASTIIHWVDGQWAVPAPSSATAGTVHPLTTVVSKTDGGGVKGWETRYSIVGGAPAEFAPTGSKTATATTDTEGQATVQIRQPAGQFEPGTTQVRVDIVRPPVFGEPELIVESGITTVTWSAPALTIRAIGPRKSEISEPFNYRVEITNPGDQVARGVVVRTKNLDDGIEFISSTPKPTEYGRQYEWTLGDIAPGSPPQIIDIQMKSQKQGNVGMCFEVASATDRLQTEACAETEIILPCIGFKILGPTSANVGDEISYILTVENQCDEPLEDIEIIVNYDPALIRPGKSNPAQFRNPILQVGENQPLPEPLTFYAQAPGTHCFNVEIRARGVQPQFDRRCVEVGPTPGGGVIGGGGSSIGNSPLELTLRPAQSANNLPTVEAVITNRGTTPIDQVALTNKTSSSIRPFGITTEFEPSSRAIDDNEFFVNVGRINPNQQVRLEINYEILQADPNALSEFTVTSNNANARDSKQIQIPTQGIQGGAGGDQPNFDNVPGNGGIGIPDGDPNSVPMDQGNLSVRIQALQPNARVGTQTSFQFSVTNSSNQTLNNVDMQLLIPGSAFEVLNLSSDDTNVGFASRWQLARINTLRPQETLTWTLTVQTKLGGEGTIEVQAKSDDAIGVTTSTDSIQIRP